VPITTKVVSSNLAHGKMYLMQHFVIKFVSDLRQAGGFSLGTPVSSTNKTDHHYITKMLLKVVLSTITITLIDYFRWLSMDFLEKCRWLDGSSKEISY
jgi:hypothetical protein